MVSNAVGTEGGEDQMARPSAKREQLAEKAEKPEEHWWIERKVQDQELILAEHLDGLEMNDFCDFDKPRKRAYQKGKIESNEQSKVGGQPKWVDGNGQDARQSQKLSRNQSSSSFELFILSIMQEDIHTLRVRSGSACESSVRLSHHGG